jgi:hypothetical protein
MLRKLAGQVMVKRAAGDDWIPAARALELHANDKVRTSTGASASIEFPNGSTVAIGEDALLAIAEGRPRVGLEAADLTVFKGRVDAELANAALHSLTVVTPSATVRAGREIVFQ